MRTVAEHLSACLEVAHAAEPLDVVLSDAVGTVLAADIVSDVDMPPANLAGLDGYAVRAKDCVMQAVTTVREGADDVYADAKAINDRRAAEAAPEVIEDTASDAE